MTTSQSSGQFLHSTLEAVQTAFNDATATAFPEVSMEASISLSNPKFGDYQCNSAMNLFKQHKEAIGLPNPKAIGEKLKEALKMDLFSEVTVAPQGFVTVKIRESWLANQLRPCVRDEIRCNYGNPLKVLIDFSSPNIAKEMHVGHLRSTIIGESLSRILEFLGHTVARTNHVGDWGTQFGMLIEHLREAHPDFQDNPPELADLCTFYRESKKRFDSDPSFKKRAQANVVALQSGDKFALDAWRMFCEISRADFKKIYDRLQVSLNEVGESFYNEMIPGVIAMLDEKGMVTKSDGATCIFVEEDPKKRENEVPLMAIKSDGGYGYDSTDLAAIYYRLKTLGNDWVIVVTDKGQENHFVSLFKAAEMAGWHCPPKTRCDHIGFGVVQGDDGKKFKTRSGDLVKLTDLLDEAVDRALKEIHDRRTITKNEADEDEKANGLSPADDEELPEREAAEKIGYSAVKYFDLKQNRVTNYKFSFEKMLDPKGNTAVYMLYAYARICAIFRKSRVRVESLHPQRLVIKEPEERALALALLRFPEVIHAIVEDLHINRLAEFMYDLSGVFTAFYQKCRVIGSDEQESRLLLCELTRKMLQKSFHLLGIQALERI